MLTCTSLVASLPQDIVTKLAQEIGAATKTRKFAEAVPDYELIGNTPAAFAEFLRKDAALTARIIAQSGMKANGGQGRWPHSGLLGVGQVRMHIPAH